MRISELFDELNQAELDELLDLPVRGTEAISARDIRRRVDRTLDEDPLERRIHMKRTYKKVLCAALIAAVLLTGALATASRLNLLRGWLPDDGIGELVVNTEKQSIENGDLRLTLEESLADETLTYIAYSLTALTDEGQAILDDLQQEQGGQYHWTGEGITTGLEPSADVLVGVYATSSTRVTNRAPPQQLDSVGKPADRSAQQAAVPLLFPRQGRRLSDAGRRRWTAECAPECERTERRNRI